jgi:FlaA1/EpsC-like NDP-sugar epimerase
MENPGALDFLHCRFRDLTRLQKRLILMPVDFALVAASLWASVTLRLGVFWPSGVWNHGWWLFLAVPLVGLVCFYFFGLYRFVLRSLGRHDVMIIARACGLLSLVLAVIGYFDTQIFLPRSTPIIFGLVLFAAMISVRGAGRSYYHWLKEQGAEKRPVIVYGAGESGIQLVSALDAAREFRPVAFLDDDRSLQSSLIAGRRVYAPDQIDTVIRKFGASDVLLALPSISRARRKEIVRFLSQRSVRVQTIPSMVELVAGFASIDKLREVGVGELLERHPVDPIIDLFSSVRGRIVMVTGAGGSIGAELCRQIIAVRPATVVLFEVSEHALYLVDQELRSNADEGIEIHAVLGSVCDEARVEGVIRRYSVQTIYHAAAYKHVPLVEMNPFEGIRNNIFGTEVIARAAHRCGVERAILISTDKAVRPTNIMGASKRLAELVFQRAQQNSRSTVFSMVRFGNVMGSSGSVIPLFQKQIAEGGPVTVTHPEVIRYFMTIPEAAQLVVQAGSMGKGGDVFLLDMGEPVSILDLAQRMIHLSGLDVKDSDNPDGEIEIVFTGLRPGEKLYEELLVSGEALPTQHPKIMRSIDASRDTDETDRALATLREAVEREDLKMVKQVLLTIVEGYVSQ